MASFFIPWGLVEIAEFPVARPLQVLWPWVKSLFEAALGAAPGELAQLTLTIALALAVWMAYGWVIGAYLDFRNAASVRREAAVSLPPA